MGATVLIVLFLVGALLATIGGIVGIVDAFRVSTVWGLLAFFVPFALLVFCIKFWNQRKWARNSLIMSLAGLAAMILPIPLGGLAFLSAGNDQEFDDFSEGVPVNPDGGVVDPNTTPDAGIEGTVEVPAEEEAELFEEAMLPGLPTAAEIARAELLPSTDPSERLNEIERERSDPYAFVPIAPPPKPAPPASNNSPNAAGNGGGNGGSPPGGATARPPAAPSSPQTGQGTNPSSPINPAASSEPLPDLPEPTVVASQVQVTGVANVSGVTYAIIKAPGEPSSRYVRQGDRISNGKVLVKRIENSTGSAPVVVFEERGEEVALPVGANSGSSEEPTASAPAISSNNLAVLPNLSLPNLP
ncbi:MAG: hypothetical protein ACFBSG_10795 [Leptolyngbyaceae cyanobacterium]